MGAQKNWRPGSNSPPLGLEPGRRAMSAPLLTDFTLVRGVALRPGR